MKLHNPGADIFIPDGTELQQALARVTHLGIGAHQDDLEFMAFHGIQACYHRDDTLVRRSDLHQWQRQCANGRLCQV